MRVSVIIPAYNRERFLADAVRSVLATGYDDLEILIVDDGSSDGTLSVSRQFSADHPGIIRALQHETGAHLGISESRNLGIRESTGELISFLDSDDAYLPNRFERAIPALLQEPSLDGAYEPVATLADADFESRLDWRTGEPGSRHGVLAEADGSNPAALLRQLLLEGRSLWSTPALTVRKSLFAKTGLFDPRFRVVEDTDLWLRMAALGHLRLLQDSHPVAAVRLHGRHSRRPTPDEGNRLYTLAVIGALQRTKRSLSRGRDAEVIATLREGLFRSGVDTLALLRAAGRPGAAIRTLLRIVLADPSLALRNLLWRMALEPRKPGPEGRVES